MPYLLCYTRKGPDSQRELNDSVHLAVSRDGEKFEPLRHNTGILFPEADFEDGGMPGKAKTLLYPWLFRWKDGKLGVIAVRRNKDNEADNRLPGRIMVYRTEDLKSFSFQGFLKLGDQEIQRPSCRYCREKNAYILRWEAGDRVYTAETADFGEAGSLRNLEEITGAAEDADQEMFRFGEQFCGECGIEGAVPSNRIEITQQEDSCLRMLHMTPVNLEVVVEDTGFEAGEGVTAGALPDARCIYSDGSEHSMEVEWNQEDIRLANGRRPGTYLIHGEIRQVIYPDPFTRSTGDPFIILYKDRYLMSWSGARQVRIRAADTLEGLHTAEEKVIYSLPEDQPKAGMMWAPELHVINGILYLFTTVGEQGKWYTVRSCVLKCTGDPENPKDWSEPVFCVRPDGSPLNEKGISLDMTYFRIDGVHYVTWSHRDIDPENYTVNCFGTNGCAVLCIATIDPERPWQLTSSPVEISRPRYGWERIENEINEGPYLLEHGEDLFLTFSCSSVSVLYCVGLLRAKRGSNLLDPGSWEKLQYPVLTKESVPDQYGPGHNNFVKSPDGRGDDLLVFHSKLYPADDPLDPEFLKNPRNAGIRRVHWNRQGYPVLDMMPEQELKPEFKKVCCRVIVK